MTVPPKVIKKEVGRPPGKRTALPPKKVTFAVYFSVASATAYSLY